MFLRLFKFTPIAALALLGFNTTPASADGCGYSDCGAPAPVVVYQSGCGCGGGSYYSSSYAPAYAYQQAYYPSSAYDGYAYAGYGYGYPAYRSGYVGGAFRAATAPYRYVNRFYRPGLVGARRYR